MNQELVKTLADARNLIADKSQWTQGALARNADGRMVRPTDPTAVCWCAVGAIMKVKDISELADVNGFFTRDPIPFERQFIEQSELTKTPIGDLYIAGINDEVGYEAVLELFDERIAFAQVQHDGK